MSNNIRVLDPIVLSKISGMELRARTVVEGFIYGLHRSPYRGFSVEFAEYREYTPGDDIRFIDWKVFARSDRYYIKEFEEETNLSCHILLDTSASMSYKSNGISKLEYSAYLAASLGYLIFQQRDGVGLMTFDNDIRQFVPFFWVTCICSPASSARPLPSTTCRIASFMVFTVSAVSA